MPISRDDFERGRTEESFEDRVTQFLGGQPDRAFNALEVANGAHLPLHPEPKAPPAGGFNTAEERLGATIDRVLRSKDILAVERILDALAGQGKIDARTVQTAKGGQRYYSARP
jgi:hypothetical protein